MLISICIPCHNRAYDVKKIMPSLIRAANASPPVEIAILDYGSPDDLNSYMKFVMGEAYLVEGNSIKYTKYEAEYYHMAHARNLSALASSGEFLILSSADMIFDENYISMIRTVLKEGDYVWLHHRWKAVLVCDRNEFMEAGGYDERFEFYGKEDKDIILRLKRRGKKSKRLPSNLLTSIPTPRKEKYKNYRLSLTRSEIYKRSKSIYEENIRNEVLVVNKGGWGKWE